MVDLSPLQALAEYCRTHPKTAGEMVGFYLADAKDQGNRVEALTACGAGLSVEDACRVVRVKLEALTCLADRVYWRQFPDLCEVSGDDERHTFGDANGLVHVRQFARPYYVCSARVGCSPMPHPAIVAALTKYEGADIDQGPALRAAVGLAKIWVWKDENTGVVYGPEPPKFYRRWCTTATSSEPICTD